MQKKLISIRFKGVWKLFVMLKRFWIWFYTVRKKAVEISDTQSISIGNLLSLTPQAICVNIFHRETWSFFAYLLFRICTRKLANRKASGGPSIPFMLPCAFIAFMGRPCIHRYLQSTICSYCSILLLFLNSKQCSEPSTNSRYT